MKICNYRLKLLLIASQTILSFYLQAQNNIATDKLYSIYSAHSERPAVISERNLIIISDAEKSAYTEWRFEPSTDGYGNLVSTESDEVLDYDANTKKLGFLFLNHPDGRNSQLWKLHKEQNGSISIISKLNGWALDIMDNKTAQGAFVVAYPYHGESNQRWVVKTRADNVLQFNSKSAGKFLGAAPSAEQNGALLTQWSDTKLSLWKIIPADDGYYYILEQNGKKALQPSNKKVNLDIAIELWELDKTKRQQWRIKEIDTKTYAIENRETGKSLDLILNSLYQGAPIISYDVHDETNQHWRLVPETID